jgi:hypothetical protein
VNSIRPEPLIDPRKEEGLDTSAERRPSVDNEEEIKTIRRDTQGTRQPKRRHLSAERDLVEKLTNKALKKLEKETMTSTVAQSEQSSTKESNITPYNLDYVLALRDRGILFANSGPRPDNLEDLEQALAPDGKSPPLDDTTVNLLQRVREFGATEIDVVARLFGKILPIDDGPCSGKDDCFVYDQPWDEGVLVHPSLRPALAVPKADRTFGWSSFTFPYPKATRHLGCAIRPVPLRPQLSWPYLTVELKGETGSLRVASLQNLHNGAVMLNNLLLLKRAAGKAGGEEEFLGKTHVLSIEFTTETITLSCYWASLAATATATAEGAAAPAAPAADDSNSTSNSGGLQYHGRRVRTWLIDDPSATACVFRAISWMQAKNFAWISADMKEVERKLQNINHGMTPPPSRSGRGTGGQKRKSSQSLSRAASRSSLRGQSVDDGESASNPGV